MPPPHSAALRTPPSPRPPPSPARRRRRSRTPRSSYRFQTPSRDHWLGTDELGRDILSRIIHGSRITLYIVTLVVVIAAPIGLLVGTVSGYFGGWVDSLLMRFTEAMLTIPTRTFETRGEALAWLFFFRDEPGGTGYRSDFS